MRLNKFIPLCVAGIVGCTTPEVPDTSAESDDDDITVQFNDIAKNQRPLFRLSVSDNNFTFTVDANGVPKFTKKNPNMSLDELTSFVRVRCLNEILYPKMTKGEPITQDEALLLIFAMDAQATMIKAIGVAMAWDIYGKGGTYTTPMPANADIPELGKREYDVFAPLIEDFVNGSGGLRDKIRAYGKNFQGMDADVKGTLFDCITQKGRLYEDIKTKPEFKKVITTHPWLVCGGLCVSSVTGAIVAYQAAQANMEHISLSESEDAALKVFADSKVGQEWLNLWEMSEVYLKEYWETYNKVKSYYTSTKLTGDDGFMAREYTKSIFQRSVPTTNLILNDYCIQFFDFPFILLTMKARGEYMNCNGFWNDDEKKMKEVMMKYGETISGTDMLSHLNSTYSIDAYADFIEKFKSDIDFMLDTNFKRFQAVTRIREFAREKTRKDLNTGLDTNGFKDIKE